jgi:hypothetical protein
VPLSSTTVTSVATSFICGVSVPAVAFSPELASLTLLLRAPQNRSPFVARLRSTPTLAHAARTRVCRNVGRAVRLGDGLGFCRQRGHSKRTQLPVCAIIREQWVTWRTVFRHRVLAERQEPVNPFCNARGKIPIAQPICRVTDSSNSLIPFQAICTPIQTRKKDDNCVITIIPVAPRIRASRSANP